MQTDNFELEKKHVNPHFIFDLKQYDSIQASWHFHHYAIKGKQSWSNIYPVAVKLPILSMLCLIVTPNGFLKAQYL